MDNLIIPKLEWPFEKSNHKDVLLLNKECNDWTRKFCGTPNIEEIVEGWKLPYFSTRIWHYGSYDRVMAIAKLVNFFFVADDYFDVKPEKWTLQQTNRMLEIAYNDEKVNLEENNWVQATFSDVWQSIGSLAPNEWKQRFIDSLLIWFRAVVLEKVQFRKSKKIPSFVEYLTLRPFSEGAEFCFYFIEFAADKYLSVKQLANPLFQALCQHCRYVLFATNDLYSFPKEKKNGDVMNVVLVFQKQYNLSAQNAIYKTVDFINEELSMYLCSKKQLLKLYPEEYDFYLDGLDSMMRGNYDFHFDSKRY